MATRPIVDEVKLIGKFRVGKGAFSGEDLKYDIVIPSNTQRGIHTIMSNLAEEDALKYFEACVRLHKVLYDNDMLVRSND